MAEPHNYGPHDPVTAPTHVVEVTAKRKGSTILLRRQGRVGQLRDADVVDVLSPVLVRQRAQINALARGETLVGLRSALCRVCSRPEWECMTMRRGLDDPHEYEPAR